MLRRSVRHLRSAEDRTDHEAQGKGMVSKEDTRELRVFQRTGMVAEFRRYARDSGKLDVELSALCAEGFRPDRGYVKLALGSLRRLEELRDCQTLRDIEKQLKDDVTDITFTDY